jgi:colanic acid/amylovoran biosynthesis glycosyltransferase
MHFLLLKKTFIYFFLLYCFLQEPYSFCEDKKTLKILMIVPSFPKIHDICMLNQITGLLEREVDVIIYTPKLGDTTKMQEDVVKYDLLSRTIISEDLPKNINDYDIVVFQLGHKAINIKKTHNFKGKVVICLRGYDITGFIKEHPYAYNEFFESCDLFMPVCNAFKTTLQKLGCDSKKIIVHHSGIDCSRFIFKQRQLPEEGTINILSAGRFVEKKGFAYSIIAVANLIKKYPRLRYTIIGDGELKKKYVRLIKRLGMTEKIKLVNWFPHDEYIQVLDKSHIFIVPSVTARDNDQEGIPNVLKEAMAMGLIVIGTNHSGNIELIKNKVSGFLVPERNSGAIVRSIEYILSHPQEWLSMQLVARDLIDKDFDNNKVNDQLEKIFVQLVHAI